MKKISSLLLFLSLFSLNTLAVDLTSWIKKQQGEQRPFVISLFTKVKCSQQYAFSLQDWNQLTPKLNKVDGQMAVISQWSKKKREEGLAMAKKRKEEFKKIKEEEMLKAENEKKSNEAKALSLGHS